MTEGLKSQPEKPPLGTFSKAQPSFISVFSSCVYVCVCVCVCGYTHMCKHFKSSEGREVGFLVQCELSSFPYSVKCGEILDF